MITRRLLCAGAALAPLSVSCAAFAQDGARFPAAWLHGIRQEALRAGVDRATLDAALADIREVPRVMEQARNQPEFKMTWERYQGLVVSDERIKPRPRAAGREPRARSSASPGPAGLPPSIVVALWGIESNYGTRLGDFEVVEALATLVYNNFRAKFFREQLIAALKILSQGHVGLHAMKGSWAGAMGQCQFIPTSFLAYAADGDGDGRKDIWTNKARRLRLDRELPAPGRLAAGPALGRRGVRRARRPGGGGRIVRPAGAGGPAYPDDRELPGDPALEPVGFLRPCRRPAVGPDRRLSQRETRSLLQPPKMMYDVNIMPLALVSTAIFRYSALFACAAPLLLLASLAACGSSSKGGGRAPGSSVAQRGTYKVGQPYKIDGITYTPQETFTLIETGVASWYGPGFHGKSTANGERYDQADRTAAHRTLQMPAIVRVTNLDNGRSPPWSGSTTAARSRAAASSTCRAPRRRRLDMVGKGTARVRDRAAPGREPGGEGRRDRAAAVRRSSTQARRPARERQPARRRRPHQHQHRSRRPRRRRRSCRHRTSRRPHRRRPRRPCMRPRRALVRRLARRGRASGDVPPTIASLSATDGRGDSVVAAERLLRPDRRVLDAGKCRDASAVRCAATASPRFRRARPADAMFIASGWGPIRLRMPPASSPTGSSVQAMVMPVLLLINRLRVCRDASRRRRHRRRSRSPPHAQQDPPNKPASQQKPPAKPRAPAVDGRQAGAKGTAAPKVEALPPSQVGIGTLARQAFMVDPQTSTVLLFKDADKPMAPSSMSKMMTIYIIFDELAAGRLKLDTRFRVSERARNMGGSRMFVELGSEVTVEDLIKGIIVLSGNDACVVIAEGLAGHRGSFRRAHDQAREGNRHDEARCSRIRRAGRPRASTRRRATSRCCRGTRSTITRSIYRYYAETNWTYNNIRQENRNRLLKITPGTDGLKTGHTEEGGYGQATSAVRDGRRLILVVNGLTSMAERAQETSRLMEWGFREFTNTTVFRAGDTRGRGAGVARRAGQGAAGHCDAPCRSRCRPARR